jgi:iron complex outermembrane receptor protein
LEEVVVTGTRARALEASESPAPIQMVSADALQRAGGKPDLVEELAMLVSSFSAQA